MSATSSTPGPATGQPARPAIVLVHGARADSSSWALVIRRLRASGYPVHAIANPLQGLVSDTAHLSSYLATIKGPVVLVAHSYGGALITNIDASAFDIRSLVYVAGFIPVKGETVGQAGRAIQPAASAGVRRCARRRRSGDRPCRLRSKRSPATSTTRPRLSSRSCSALPTSRPSRKQLPARRSVQFPPGCSSPGETGRSPMTCSSSWPGRTGAQVTALDASHAVMLSHPGAVADVITKPRAQGRSDA